MLEFLGILSQLFHTSLDRLQQLFGRRSWLAEGDDFSEGLLKSLAPPHRFLHLGRQVMRIILFFVGHGHSPAIDVTLDCICHQTVTVKFM